MQGWETEHAQSARPSEAEGIDMSSTDASRYTDAVTMASLVEEALSEPDCETGTARLKDEAGDVTLATEPWPPRPVSPARIGLSPKAHPRAYNDPSNYLG